MRSNGRRGARPVHLLLLGWLIAVVALAGPAWRIEPNPFAEETAAWVVVIEVTESMTAGDVQPSRLERAGQKVGDLLQLRSDVDVALFAYSTSAHRAMPLTHDTSIVATFARSLSPAVMPVVRGGARGAASEAAANAIAQANAELERAGRSGSIVLISDGVGPSELQAIEAAGSVPVHVLAMGAPPTDRPSLERLAEATGGSLTLVTPDARDVAALADRAQSKVARAPGDADARAGNYRDDGYLLLPVLALVVLLWSRRGWSLELPRRAA